MEQQVQLIQITAQQLQDAIIKGIADQLQELKKTFQPKQPTEYLSRQETADLLKVDLSSLHNWRHNGTLVPLKIGNRVLYTRKSIEDALITLNK
ncbi:helix-turn-helix domain-containing protein [Tenacibaculum finnmarkense]|uniref:Helix-turn-helix domain-containing protein n=1 Tax=Tenacibaculum finnmarkense genomovar finnmarkense TaxID=1458503 RepID=A0AAP1RDW5_9FLAO|nr:helix-turn-helix domain-containing protein [Tenacibaculum finnmarkense]ALU75414.1 DNA-binding protein [Tenacibaculum dicentrarchi]MBE7652314.1 helix-turn-helix domain-containing protein [Tenacibaculum finnmarkense genomovar finnmarkense]MBE7694514.1 helix-turn-helix domain-containing protein [Tenacibaculum finnmarkense genomovar finnmarkense]MCD8426701.1 helix-turn-helix domain-containing protein [Tenacibaculum finnmarkense genomovar finnmarkense]MCG8751006.1 helix-turn-helix domain-contain